MQRLIEIKIKDSQETKYINPKYIISISNNNQTMLLENEGEIYPTKKSIDNLLYILKNPSGLGLAEVICQSDIEKAKERNKYIEATEEKLDKQIEDDEEFPFA